MLKTTEDTVPVLLLDLIDLAVEVWRLENGCRNVPESPIFINHFLRRAQAFLEKYEVETVDLTNKIYEPGLAVEVVDLIDQDSDAGQTEVIDEMVAPIVLQNGRVVKHGQIVLRR